MAEKRGFFKITGIVVKNLLKMRTFLKLITLLSSIWSHSVNKLPGSRHSIEDLVSWREKFSKDVDTKAVNASSTR